MLKTNLITGWDFGVKNRNEINAMLHDFYRYNCKQLIIIKKYTLIF